LGERRTFRTGGIASRTGGGLLPVSIAATAAGEPALEGSFIARQLRSGIFLHATDVREHEFISRFEVDPDIIVFVVLDGTLVFDVDDRPFRAADRGHCSDAGDCIALRRREHAYVVRKGLAGQRIRKVAVSVSGDWLQDLANGLGGPALRQFTGAHLAHAGWRATPRLRALAEQVLNPPELMPLLQDMYIESRCIEILGEAFATLGGDASVLMDAGQSTRDVLKARAARDYIEANLDKALTLSDIAREVGVSVSSLQRSFRAVYGNTVVDYLRTRKLEGARDALERGTMSIAEAAFLAGYTSPANFTTAFRRAFGLLPRSLKR
jgi:AraC-like DNA-binding protein